MNLCRPRRIITIGAMAPSARYSATTSSRSGALVEAHLVPGAALAEHLAVVAGDDDDRAVEAARVPEHADQPGHMVVHVGDRAVVGPAGRPDVVPGDLHAVHHADRAEPALVR